MKIGIKSEIHDCTIELCRFLEEREILSKGTTEILSDDKELRIDNQYYLKNRKVDINFSELRDFVLKIKNKVNTITFEEIKAIREELIGLLE